MPGKYTEKKRKEKELKFIEESKISHDIEYDYSKVFFKRQSEEVIIICPIHDEFEQKPQYHKYGADCPKCSVIKKALKMKEKKRKIFFRRAVEKHGELYDYSDTIYSGVDYKLWIRCPRHGKFEQWPRDHLNGSGCPTCGTLKTAEKKMDLAKEKFIPLVTKIHQGKYDYSKTFYKRNDLEIVVGCSVHGDFTTTPFKHLYLKNGCPQCSPTYSPDTEGFIVKIKKKYEDRFDCSRVNYINTRTDVELGCSKHGWFTQNPNNLLQGHHCQLCGFERAEPGFKPREPAITYYFKDITTNLFKIGITNLTVRKRFGPQKLKEIKILRTWEFEKGEDAYRLEQSILEEHAEFRVDNDNFRSVGGYTEFFSRDILNLDKEVSDEISTQEIR